MALLYVEISALDIRFKGITLLNAKVTRRNLYGPLNKAEVAFDLHISVTFVTEQLKKYKEVGNAQ